MTLLCFSTFSSLFEPILRQALGRKNAATTAQQRANTRDDCDRMASDIGVASFLPDAFFQPREAFFNTQSSEVLVRFFRHFIQLCPRFHAHNAVRCQP